MDLEDLFYRYQDKAALELREALLKFGIGLSIGRRIRSDAIKAFPTKRYNLKTHKGIWEIDLDRKSVV